MKVHKSVLLPCDNERAFALFTQEMSVWWPENRRHTKDPASRIELLPGGRFFERAGDGHEVDLGHVRVYEPPELLVVDCYIATGLEHPTELVVRFAPEGEGTRVSIEHGPTPASEELFAQRAPRFEASWAALLEALSRASNTPG